jgi:hypothetical protein
MSVTVPLDVASVAASDSFDDFVPEGPLLSGEVTVLRRLIMSKTIMS